MLIVPLDRKFYADAKIGVVFVFQGSIIRDIKNDDLSSLVRSGWTIPLSNQVRARNLIANYDAIHLNFP